MIFIIGDIDKDIELKRIKENVSQRVLVNNCVIENTGIHNPSYFIPNSNNLIVKNMFSSIQKHR